MDRTFIEAMKHRRTYYAIGNLSSISEEEIASLLKEVIMHVPSAFNSQSTRMVLLLDEEHLKLWDIVKDALKQVASAESFIQAEQKINNSFQNGFGTVLFFEDELVVKGLQRAYPTYADKFPEWSMHTSGMHQFATWTLLEDAGLGASLQHYNPLIDEQVIKTWKLPEQWKLVAQMPFGLPKSEPGKKEFNDLSGRFMVFE